MAKAKRRLNAFGTIDVTPLVDLTFLLLIVFMITSPALEYAVEVSPPALNSDPIDSEEPKVVTINRTGEIFLGGVQMTVVQMEDELRALVGGPKRLQIFIRADEVRPYGEVIGVMRRIQHLGIEEVSLVTQPED